MNTIYRITLVRNEYMSFVLDDKDLTAKMGEDIYLLLYGKSIKDKWVTPEGDFLPSDTESMVLPDIAEWASCLLILNQKAHDLLIKHISSFGEILDINVHGEKYYLFSPLTIVDDIAINIFKSKKAIFKGSEVGVKKLVFNTNLIDENLLLFKTTYDNGVFLFCTERFKNLVEKLKLSGITFTTELAVNPLAD